MDSSSESDRSIAGISLPQWMKNRINDRYDLDQSTFSPPTEDDSFFYIRYPKTEGKHLEHNNDPNYRSISEVLQNHTLPCQDFIPAAKVSPRELGLKRGVIAPPLGVAKSTGTDDGFHSAAAACGQSVVAVAHQMIADGKLLTRRNPASASSSSQDSDEETATPPPPHVLAKRRSSRSLPSSPQTSPKFLRKNPFFADGLLGSTDNIAAGDVAKRSWILSYVRDSHSLQSSLSDLKIPEEPTSAHVEPAGVKPKHTIVKPKPSQLREMNFWSPTSM